MAVKVGDRAKDFALPDQNGTEFRLSEIIGRENIVLYFYPKDETMGCIAEACSFRDNIALFKGLEASVIGVSSDSVESHKKFARHHNLPFTLLSDTDKKVVNLYGVETMLLGLVPGRKTYIISKKGVVTHIFDHRFKARQHVADALKAIPYETNT